MDRAILRLAVLVLFSSAIELSDFIKVSRGSEFGDVWRVHGGWLWR